MRRNSSPARRSRNARPHGSDWSSIREAGIKGSSTSLMWKLPEQGSYGEGKLKMWLTHRYFEQVKQAEKLAQKGTVRRLIICRRDEKSDEICTRFIISPEMYPVESIRLQERKTDHWNGITLKKALAVGRYNEQGTTRMHLRVGLPKKQTPAGKLLDRLT